jgi:integrase
MGHRQVKMIHQVAQFFPGARQHDAATSLDHRALGLNQPRDDLARGILIQRGVGEKDVEDEGWLTFTQQKTGGEVSIPFRRELPEFAERYACDLALLHQAIKASGKHHMTFLYTQHGTSRSSKSVSQWFSAKAKAAGVEDRTAHGLRKSRVIALAEPGGTSPQIGAWTGPDSLA